MPADPVADLPPPKHIFFTDRRTGRGFVMEIPATSPWHELLPQHQEAEIRAVTPEQAAQP